MTDRELALQIEGQRSGKGYNVDIYADDRQFVVFYNADTSYTKFNNNYIDTFTENELKAFYLLLDEIKKMKTFHTSIVVKSYDITHFQLETNSNSITAYVNKEIDTKAIQKLVSFIIKKSDGKLDFLHSYDYFNLEKN